MGVLSYVVHSERLLWRIKTQPHLLHFCRVILIEVVFRLQFLLQAPLIPLEPVPDQRLHNAVFQLIQIKEHVESKLSDLKLLTLVEVRLDNYVHQFGYQRCLIATELSDELLVMRQDEIVVHNQVVQQRELLASEARSCFLKQQGAQERKAFKI